MATVALNVQPEQLDRLLVLSILPVGVKGAIQTPIKFLNVMRQKSGSVREFVRELENMLAVEECFIDLHTIVRSLCNNCADTDLNMSATQFPNGLGHHNTSEQQNSCFNKVLLRISDYIPSESLDIMVALTPIPESKKESIRQGYKLFHEMKQCGCISENDVEFLDELFEVLKLVKPIELLDKYKKQFPPVAYPVYTPQPLLSRPQQPFSTPIPSQQQFSMPVQDTSPIYGSLPVQPSPLDYKGVRFATSLPEMRYSTHQSSEVPGRSISQSGVSASNVEGHSMVASQSSHLEDTASSDEYRTAPATPITITPPTRSHDHIPFQKSISLNPQSGGSRTWFIPSSHAPFSHSPAGQLVQNGDPEPSAPPLCELQSHDSQPSQGIQSSPISNGMEGSRSDLLSYRRSGEDIFIYPQQHSTGPHELVSHPPPISVAQPHPSIHPPTPPHQRQSTGPRELVFSPTNIQQSWVPHGTSRVHPLTSAAQLRPLIYSPTSAVLPHPPISLPTSAVQPHLPISPPTSASQPHPPISPPTFAAQPRHPPIPVAQPSSMVSRVSSHGSDPGTASGGHQLQVSGQGHSQQSVTSNSSSSLSSFQTSAEDIFPLAQGRTHNNTNSPVTRVTRSTQRRQNGQTRHSPSSHNVSLPSIHNSPMSESGREIVQCSDTQSVSIPRHVAARLEPISRASDSRLYPPLPSLGNSRSCDDSEVRKRKRTPEGTLSGSGQEEEKQSQKRKKTASNDQNSGLVGSIVRYFFRSRKRGGTMEEEQATAVDTNESEDEYHSAGEGED